MDITVYFQNDTPSRLVLMQSGYGGKTSYEVFAVNDKTEEILGTGLEYDTALTILWDQIKNVRQDKY